MTAHLRTIDFRQPRWRPPEPFFLRLFILGTATGIWVFLYGWLCLHVWNFGFRPTRISITLLALSILLGVSVVFGWQRTLRNRPFTLPSLFSRTRPLTKEQMLRLDPAEFEDYVAEHIFKPQGYDVHDTPHVKDGGVDILLEDEHGAHAVVQCKRYRGTVGAPTVRGLYGTMIHAGAAEAWLVTTGRISNDARNWAAGKPIRLIDGEMLEQLAKSQPDARPMRRVTRTFSIRRLWRKIRSR